MSTNGLVTLHGVPINAALLITIANIPVTYASEVSIMLHANLRLIAYKTAAMDWNVVPKRTASL